VAAYPVIGVIAVQPILFAMWAGMHRKPLYQRILSGGLGCLVVAFAGGLGEIHHSGSHSVAAIAKNIAVMLVFFALATLVLWIVGRLFRSQITQGDGESSTGESLGNQFHVGHLLAWTGISGGLLGLARFLVGHGPSSDVSSPWRQPTGQVALGLVFLLVVLFPTLVLPWIALAYRGRGTFLVLAAVLAWGLLTYGCIVVLAQMPEVSFLEIAQPVVLIQLGAGLAGLLSALTVRFCGFRITRY
jgi:hypothetical protein